METNEKSESGERYHSFLLRLWQAGGDGKSVWRAALENPLTGEKRAFPDIAAMMDYLRRVTQTPGEITVEHRVAASSLAHLDIRLRIILEKGPENETRE